MLKLSSGKTIQIFSGLVVTCKALNQTEITHDQATLELKTLTETEIENYLSTDEPLTAAGAIVLEKKGSLFIKAIHGSYSTILGLPTYHLNQILKKFNAAIL